MHILNIDTNILYSGRLSRYTHFNYQYILYRGNLSRYTDLNYQYKYIEQWQFIKIHINMNVSAGAISQDTYILSINMNIFTGAAFQDIHILSITILYKEKKLPVVLGFKAS